MKIVLSLILIVSGLVLLGIGLPEQFQRIIKDVAVIPIYKEETRVVFGYIGGMLVSAGIFTISRRD